MQPATSKNASQLVQLFQTRTETKKRNAGCPILRAALFSPKGGRPRKPVRGLPVSPNSVAVPVSLTSCFRQEEKLKRETRGAHSSGFAVQPEGWETTKARLRTRNFRELSGGTCVFYQLFQARRKAKRGQWETAKAGSRPRSLRKFSGGACVFYRFFPSRTEVKRATRGLHPPPRRSARRVGDHEIPFKAFQQLSIFCSMRPKKCTNGPYHQRKNGV